MITEPLMCTVSKNSLIFVYFLPKQHTIILNENLRHTVTRTSLAWCQKGSVYAAINKSTRNSLFSKQLASKSIPITCASRCIARQALYIYLQCFSKNIHWQHRSVMKCLPDWVVFDAVAVDKRHIFCGSWRLSKPKLVTTHGRKGRLVKRFCIKKWGYDKYEESKEKACSEVNGKS